MVELLSGYTVLDLTDLKGQFAGRLLRDLGMRVVKIEPPEGDAVRRFGPFRGDRPDLDASLRFAFLNGGKESVTLDLESADGRAMLLRLVQDADVVLESFAPGYLPNLGLGYDDLQQINPGLVMASVTGFGQDGPRAGYLTPDIVGLAMGGLMYISGDPNLPPVKAPETQAFYYTCVFTVLGILMALFERENTGQGDWIDVSIQESIATQEHMIREAAFDGVAITRNGSQHKHTAPANIFACRDGHVYLFILSARDWDRFLGLWTEHPAELDAPELKPPSNRRRHLELINPLVEQFTMRYAKGELTALLQTHGIPCLPVNSPTDFLNEEQIRARGLFGSDGGPDSYVSLRFPVMFDDERLAVAGPPPAIGEHNASVFGDGLGATLSDLMLMFGRGTI
jgi:benzylsuccinate CoA-transferase BbsE subunit